MINNLFKLVRLLAFDDKEKLLRTSRNYKDIIKFATHNFYLIRRGEFVLNQINRSSCITNKLKKRAIFSNKLLKWGFSNRKSYVKGE